MTPTIKMHEEEMREESEIQKFFTGTNVFITGASGFLGKLLMEKLLRTCSEIEKVYILIREKKGKSVEQRVEEIFNIVLFDPLKKQNPDFLTKVVVLTGDCVLPDLGLTSEDKQKLIDNVNCVFHCAATVRFDAKLRTATYINVRATRDLLAMSKQMKKLKSFVYISTAFSNCVRMEIDEKFYEPTVTGDNLLKLMDTLDDEVLERITPSLIGKWPNTYVFSKAAAEELVKTHAKELPVALVRPSIVTSTFKEPLGGWIDNVYGVTGVLVGGALGLIRTIHVNMSCLADLVPADYVINCTIAAAWDISTKKTLSLDNGIIREEAKNEKDTKESDIPIVYNYVSSPQKPLDWGTLMKMSEYEIRKLPSPLEVWHNCFIPNSNYYVHYLCLILLHRVPAYIVDFIARCIGKEPMMVKGYQRIEKFLDVISYFSTKTWRFHDNNVQGLWKKLNVADRKFFEFGWDNFEWKTYFRTYCIGGRVYLLKDPLDTIPQGRIRYYKLKVAHYVLVTLLSLGLYKILRTLWNIIF